MEPPKKVAGNIYLQPQTDQHTTRNLPLSQSTFTPIFFHQDRLSSRSFSAQACPRPSFTVDIPTSSVSVDNGLNKRGIEQDTQFKEQRPPKRCRTAPESKNFVKQMAEYRQMRESNPETLNILIQNKWKELDAALLKLDPLNERITETLMNDFIEFCLIHLNKLSPTIPTEWDLLLSSEALKKIPLLMKELEKLSSNICGVNLPAFDFSQSVQKDVLQKFIDYDCRLNLRNLLECDTHADFQWTLENEILHLRQQILEKHFKNYFAWEKISEEFPSMFALLVKQVYNKSPAPFDTMSGEEIKSYLLCAERLGFEEATLSLTNYLTSSHPFSSERLMTFIFLFEESCLSVTQEIKKKIFQLIEEQLNECLQKYVKNPFSNAACLEILKTYGYYLKNLSICLTPGIHKGIPFLFPYLENLTLDLNPRYEEPNRRKWEQLVGQLPYLKSLTLEFAPETINLSEFEKTPFLEKLNIQVDQKTVIKPFRDASKMVNLSEIRFTGRQDDDSESAVKVPDDILRSMKSLPALKNLDISYMASINFNSLLNSLSPSLQELSLKDCSFYFRSPDERPLKLSEDQFEVLQHAYPYATIFYDDGRDASDKIKHLNQIRLNSLENLISVISDEQVMTMDTNTAEALLDECTKDFKGVFSTIEGIRKRRYNRYADILPYDYNSLTKQIGYYFNASPIEGMDKRRRYASQGPTQETLGRFWGAVSRLDVNLIVMATPLIEAGTRKCECYWPRLKEEISYTDRKGDIVKIFCRDEKEDPDSRITIREFDIESNLLKKTVTQFHISDWQDFGGFHPVRMKTILDKIIEFENSMGQDFSSLIHCSAGCGRTGLLFACLAIEKGLQKLIAQDSEKVIQPNQLSLDLKQTLYALRNQRNEMVQSSSQLISIVEYFKYRVKEEQEKINRSRNLEFNTLESWMSEFLT